MKNPWRKFAETMFVMSSAWFCTAFFFSIIKEEPVSVLPNTVFGWTLLGAAMFGAGLRCFVDYRSVRNDNG